MRTSTKGRRYKPDHMRRMTRSYTCTPAMSDALDQLQADLGEEYTHASMVELLLRSALRQLGREPAKTQLQEALDRDAS